MRCLGVLHAMYQEYVETKVSTLTDEVDVVMCSNLKSCDEGVHCSRLIDLTLFDIVSVFITSGVGLGHTAIV